VKHFSVAELKEFEDMIDAMVLHPDPARFRRVIEDIGLLHEGEPFGDDEIVEYFGHFYEFIQIDGDYTITAAYASETVRRFFDQRGLRRDHEGIEPAPVVRDHQPHQPRPLRALR